MFSSPPRLRPKSYPIQQPSSVALDAQWPASALRYGGRPSDDFTTLASTLRSSFSPYPTLGASATNVSIILDGASDARGSGSHGFEYHHPIGADV